jgi:Trk K+ transport system NAD-binding subunit
MNSWARELEDDLVGLCDLDAQRNATAKVVDIGDELVNIVCRPSFTMLSGCLLTVLIRAATLREITSTSFSSYAL